MRRGNVWYAALEENVEAQALIYYRTKDMVTKNANTKNLWSESQRWIELEQSRKLLRAQIRKVVRSGQNFH